jgi:catechol 2,3-dioxygenase-like lactoylglutathione lyase family enzyme
MFDHVELPVSDLGASAAFYSTVLAPLGLADSTSSDAYVEFGALSLVQRTPREPAHLAFIAESEDGHNVEAVYRTPETRSGWSFLGRGLVRA